MATNYDDWLSPQAQAHHLGWSPRMLRRKCEEVKNQGGEHPLFSSRQEGRGRKPRWQIKLKRREQYQVPYRERHTWLANTAAILRSTLRSEKTKFGHGGLFRYYDPGNAKELDNLRGFHREYKRSPLVPREEFRCAYVLPRYLPILQDPGLVKHHYFISENAFDLVFPLAFGEEGAADIKSELKHDLCFGYPFSKYRESYDFHQGPSNQSGYFLTSEGFDLAFGDSLGAKLRNAIDECRTAPTVRREVTETLVREEFEIALEHSHVCRPITGEPKDRSCRLFAEYQHATNRTIERFECEIERRDRRFMRRIKNGDEIKDTHWRLVLELRGMTIRWIEIETGKEVNL